MTRFWLDECECHPVQKRLSCLEALGLIVLILIGWTAALWLDSIMREASAIKRPAAEEGK